MNLYGYVLNDPVGKIDPSGLSGLPILLPRPMLRPPMPRPIVRPTSPKPIGGSKTRTMRRLKKSECKEDEKEETCEEEWIDAIERCEKLLDQRNPGRNLTGGHKRLRECAKGFVTEKCWGNEIDWGKYGGPYLN